jgi:hypothetical protein
MRRYNMKSTDLINTICTIRNLHYDFDTIQSCVVFEMSERKYEITLKKINGVLTTFELRDTGKVQSKEAEAVVV